MSTYQVTLRFTIRDTYARESTILEELEESVQWLIDHGAIRLIEQLRDDSLPRLIYVAEEDEDEEE